MHVPQLGPRPITLLDLATYSTGMPRDVGDAPASNDMPLWLRRNMQDTGGTLALSHAAYRQRQAIPTAIGFDDAAPMSGLGLGWVISEAVGTRPLLVEKSGAGVGFIGFSKNNGNNLGAAGTITASPAIGHRSLPIRPESQLWPPGAPSRCEGYGDPV
jgi:hypothetical protein